MKKLYKIIEKHKFLLLLFLLTLAFFYKQLLRFDQIISPAFDLRNTYAFLRIFFVESVRKYGEIPLWNPFSFGGEPFLASSQSAIFYPPNILYFLSSPDLIFGYIYMLDIFLLGLFTYFFAREIKLDKFSSFISAITMMFSGIITTKILSGHIVILDAIVWFPLLMLLYEKSIATNKYLYFVLSAVPIGLMLLAGNAQIAIYTISASLFYLFFRKIYIGIKEKKIIKNIVQGLIISGISLVAGFSLAAIQLIPSYEFSQASIRSEGLPYGWASDFSLHPYQWLSIFLPHFFGYPLNSNTYWGFNGNFWEVCIYIGIFPLILAFLAIILKRTHLILFFSILAVFSILFASGRFSFVFPFFFEYIPSFDLFRAPARFLYLYGFAISILTGFGCNILLSEKLSKENKKTLRKITILLIVVFFVFIQVFAGIFINKINIINILQTHGYAIGNNLEKIKSLILKDMSIFGFLIISSIGILILRIKNLANIKYIKILIFFLILSDLWLFGLKFYTTKSLRETYQVPAQIKKIKKDTSLYRVFDYDGKLNEITGRNNIYSLTGFESLYFKEYRDFLWLAGSHSETPYEGFFTFSSIDNFNILKLLNTKYIVTSRKLTSNVIEKGENLYELIDTFPHAYIVPNAIVVKNKKELTDNLTNKSFNYKNSILLEKYPHYPIKNSSSYQPVNITSFSPNKVELSVSLKESGFLVLSDIWDYGWKAYDNGKKTEVLKANGIFRSIYLKEGNHSVVFIYQPDSYGIGKKITLFALFSIILLVALQVKIILKNRLKFLS